MTTDEMHNYIDGLYADPILTKWKPSDYEQKYYTPRKIEKMRVKEDEKLKIKFDKETAVKKNVHRIIDEIATYPAAISALFFQTLVDNINYLKMCHDKYLDAKDRIEKLGHNALAVAHSVRYDMEKYETSFSFSGRRQTKKTMRILSDDEWTKFADRFMYEYDHPAKSIENPKEFMQMVIDMHAAYERDDLALKGENAYRDSIIHMCDNLEEILKSIKIHFNGNKPTQCITDAQWGYKGEFCGILTDGVVKVSFKSFAAGGFNIQRYHFRFKVTKLK